MGVYRQSLISHVRPAGADGLITINESPLHVKVPTGRQPVVEEHEGLTIVVLNTSQVDSSFLTATGLLVGARGLDDQDKPIPIKGGPAPVKISLTGRMQTIKVTTTTVSKPPKLSNWQQAGLDALIDGTSKRYQAIEGPASLEQMGCLDAYGWYRLVYRSPAKGNALAPQWANRVRLFHNGQPMALLGENLASDQTRIGNVPRDGINPVSLKLDGQVVALAENLGRFSDGWSLGRPTGLWGHLLSVERVKLGQPKRLEAKTPDYSLTKRSYLPHT